MTKGNREASVSPVASSFVEGDIPEGWAVCAMGDIADVVGGGTPKANDPSNFSDNGHPWITPVDLSGFTDMYIRQGSRSLSNQGLTSSSAKLLPSGTVLMSSRAPIGYLAIAATEVSTNQGFKSFVCKEGIHPEYIYYWLKFATPLIEEMGSGSTFTEVSGSRCREIPLLLAPTNEQRQIATKAEELLARVNAARERLARVPTILKRFRQSILAAACSGRLTEEWRLQHGDVIFPAHQALLEPSNSLPDADEHLGGQEFPESWIRCRVDAIVAIQNGRAFPSKEYQEGGVRLLRPGNLHINGRVEWSQDNTACLPPRWAEDFPEYVLGSGELLMNLTAQSLRDEFLGRACLKQDNGPALLNQRIARFQAAGPFDVRPYLLFYFRSKFFRAFVNGLDTGSLIRHMHSKDVARHVLSLPPPQEQTEIVRRAASLLAVVDLLQERLGSASKSVERQTQAILGKAFRGELVPTEADLAHAERHPYEPASALLDRIRAGRVPESSLKSLRSRKAGERGRPKG